MNTVTDNHCSGCASWKLEEGKTREECDQGTCGDATSPQHEQVTMFADGCGTWKPMTGPRAPLS